MNVRHDGDVDDLERCNADPTQIWAPPQRKGLYGGVFKRVLDVVLVLLAAPVVVPAVAALALWLARDGRSPFCRETRLGRGGRTFTLWTLRSTEPGLPASIAEATRPTAFGQMLCRTSLDELPQLWNVLKGEMSLVGPRPMLPEQKPLYLGRTCFILRPGLTGLWQVSGRDSTSFAERAELDADYARRLSLATDLQVLLATVSAAVRGKER